MVTFDENSLFIVIMDLWGMICSKIGIIAFMYVLVLIAVTLDLWSGIRKAKQRGEYASSFGMRRTFDKLAKYYNVIMALTVADLLQMGFIWHYNTDNEAGIPLVPILTAIGGFFVCIVEVKSICESADKKMKGQFQETAKQISEALKQKDKAGMISALLSELAKVSDEKGKDNG